MTSVSPVVVLLVEDEQLIRDVIEADLGDAGFEVIAFGAGAPALAEMKSDARHIRALITDIRLGKGPSGWEIAKQAREIDHTLPVIYITADSEDRWPVEGVPHSLILTKPFAPAQLVTALSTLLNQVDSQPR